MTMLWENIFKTHFPLLRSMYISNVKLWSLLFSLNLETYFASVESVKLGIGLTMEGYLTGEATFSKKNEFFFFLSVCPIRERFSLFGNWRRHNETEGMCIFFSEVDIMMGTFNNKNHCDHYKCLSWCKHSRKNTPSF